MVQSPAQFLVALESGAPAVAAARQDVSEILPYSVSCTVLTPSRTVIAKGRATPRRQDHTAEAYSVQLSEIEPHGVLEAMVYANKPTVILRTEAAVELHLRIDHITGSVQHREYYCHVA